MLKYLKVNNGIKHHAVTYNFDKGLTAVTGANGSGKSLLIEYIRYALFGTKALRGTLEDFPNLSVVLSFDLKDQNYIISRSLKKVLLEVEGHETATGTTSVNNKILEDLGYGLTIFDMANCALQNEVTALGKMSPAERKAAVDKTIGLDVIDKIANIYKGEAKELNQKIDIIKENLIKPTVPIKPEKYYGAEKCLTDFKAKQNTEIQLKPIRKIKQPVWSLKVLEKEWKKYYQQGKIKLARKIELEQALANHVEPNITKEKLKRLENQWKEFKIFKNLPAKPERTVRLLKQDLSNWELYSKLSILPEKAELSLNQIKIKEKQWDKREAFERATNEVATASKTTCPECGNKFLIDVDEKIIKLAATKAPVEPKVTHSKLEVMKKAHEAWKEFKNVSIPEKPELSLSEIADALKAHKILNENEIKKVDEPRISEYEIRTQNLAHTKAEELKELKTELQNLVVDKELEEKRRVALEYYATMESFQLKTKLEQQLKSLPKIETEVLGTLAVDSAVYEKELTSYKKQEIIYSKQLQKVTNLKGTLQNLRNAVTGLKQLKLDIKQYLVPNLSKVASYLSQEMSEGRFTSINITEDFSISANKIKLALLSGSEQAIINLAVRLALGQILVGKKMSLFIGDELDASMEEARADEVAKALENLTNIFDQILVVSHKQINADQEIRVGS